VRSSTRWFFSLAVVAALVGGYLFFRRAAGEDPRSNLVRAWLRSPEGHPDWAVKAGERCEEAPFLFPTDGFIGFLWDDSFRPGHRHQGLDIFGGEQPGQTRVVAAYDGYLTRLSSWKSALILRIPEDPIQPSRQIWIYYTHLADKDGDSLVSPDYPPGTFEKFVKAGTLLGTQGNFSGDPGNPVGVHLHFSIVRDDGRGNFLNELDIENTLDPSPYFNLPLGRQNNPNNASRIIPVCPAPSP
jgi:hypothetical protein